MEKTYKSTSSTSGMQSEERTTTSDEIIAFPVVPFTPEVEVDSAIAKVADFRWEDEDA